MDQAYNNEAIVPGDAPISPSADAPLISTDNKEAGLWLWRGEAVPTPSLCRPKSRDQKVLHRIIHAARRTGRIGLPIGFAFALIAAPPPNRRSKVNPLACLRVSC